MPARLQDANCRQADNHGYTVGGVLGLTIPRAHLSGWLALRDGTPLVRDVGAPPAYSRQLEAVWDSVRVGAKAFWLLVPST